jgi:hypothetical protein
MIGYFTIDSVHYEGYIDWDWLLGQEAHEESEIIRHMHFESPIVIKMNGHRNKGIILKPG